MSNDPRRAKELVSYHEMRARLGALFYPTPGDREDLRRAWCDGETDPEPPPLSGAQIEEIAQRARAATPGPWHWTHEIVNAYLRARPREMGASKKRHFVYLLQGRAPYPGQDHHDKQVLALGWWQVKGDEFYPSPSPQDRAFIAAARSDVERLLATLRAAQARIAELEERLGCAGAAEQPPPDEEE